MTSCSSCGGQVGKVEGEEVCLTCGQLAPSEPLLQLVPGHSDRLLTIATLGSVIGKESGFGTTTFLDGQTLSVSRVKRRLTIWAGPDQLAALEMLVERAASNLGLGHTATTEAVFVARQTHPRSRKLHFRLAVLSAHAILTALRRAGRTDISTEQVMEAHANLGKPMMARHLFRVMAEFPLPPARKEDFLAMAVRRVFAERSDPRLIGSVLTEAKAVLAGFGLSGRKPRTLAAMALYVAGRKAGAKVSQRECAKAVGVTEYTVRDALTKEGYLRGVRCPPLPVSSA